MRSIIEIVGKSNTIFQPINYTFERPANPSLYGTIWFTTKPSTRTLAFHDVMIPVHLPHMTFICSVSEFTRSIYFNLNHVLLHDAIQKRGTLKTARFPTMENWLPNLYLSGLCNGVEPAFWHSSEGRPDELTKEVNIFDQLNSFYSTEFNTDSLVYAMRTSSWRYLIDLAKELGWKYTSNTSASYKNTRLEDAHLNGMDITLDYVTKYLPVLRFLSQHPNPWLSKKGKAVIDQSWVFPYHPHRYHSFDTDELLAKFDKDVAPSKKRVGL